MEKKGITTPADTQDDNMPIGKRHDIEEEEYREEEHDREEEDDDTGYDILPSNGPGLAGDDGEQTVDEGEVDE